MEESVIYKDKIINYKIIQRKRKTIGIRIENDGSVLIIASPSVPKEYIKDLVKRKGQWIIIKQGEIKRQYNKKINRDIVSGNTLMYLGEEVLININLNITLKNIIVELIEVMNQEKNLYESEILISTNTLEKEKIRLALEMWYRNRTLELVTTKISKYQVYFNDNVTEIKVKEQKMRWASCTWKNSILFNWRCSMAREDVIDYIVIHEMCHIDHKNHSRDFWKRVESIMPDYKEKHNWLKVNGINMTL